MNNKYVILLLSLLANFDALAYNYTNGDFKIDANGYIGYKYITASQQHSVLPSAPELGLTLSAQYGNHLSAYTQFAYDDQIDRSLVYSFLAYDIQFENDLKLTLKGGKLRHQYALYNSYRVNPRTRPGVIVPQAIYWDALSHILTSGVGIGFDATWNNFEFGYEIDDPATGNPKEEAVVWSSGILNRVNTSFGSHQSAYIKYSFDDIPLITKFSWMRVDLGKDISPIAIHFLPYIKNKEQIVDILIGSAQYNVTEKLTLTSEILVNKVPVPTFPYGFSTTVKYDVTDNVSVYSNYNYFNSPQVPGIPPSHWYRKSAGDANIGINYHEDKWQIGAEVHHINGGRWSNPQDFASDPTGYKDWWMVGINFAYFF